MFYLFISEMVTPWIDILPCEFFLFLHFDRCLGPKSQLIKRSYSVFIETIRLNNTESNKWYLRLKPILRRKRQDIMMSLLGGLAQYRRPESVILRAEIPYQGKRYYYELTSAVRHNNTDLNKWYLGSKLLLRKRYYHELNRVAWHNNADLRKQHLPQNSRDDNWMLGAV